MSKDLNTNTLVNIYCLNRLFDLIVTYGESISKSSDELKNRLENELQQRIEEVLFLHKEFNKELPGQYEEK